MELQDSSDDKKVMATARRLNKMVDNYLDLNDREKIEVAASVMATVINKVGFKGDEGLSPAQKAAHFFTCVVEQESRQPMPNGANVSAADDIVFGPKEKHHDAIHRLRMFMAKKVGCDHLGQFELAVNLALELAGEFIVEGTEGFSPAARLVHIFAEGVEGEVKARAKH